ncbi:MAG: HAMP domain-containing histidine kinase [Lachnospiraceae bacterium]|jgi:signal transduction histidine kinase|nr:HAMP domain-containing histidine kinase [Lachnospiraceae bacterium]
MKKKWIRKPIFKAITLVAMHILAGLCAVSLLGLLLIPAVHSMDFSDWNAKSFEDTNTFKWEIQGANLDILNGLSSTYIFEDADSDGGKRLIDLNEFVQSNGYYNETSGLPAESAQGAETIPTDLVSEEMILESSSGTAKLNYKLDDLVSLVKSLQSDSLRTNIYDYTDSAVSNLQTPIVVGKRQDGTYAYFLIQDFISKFNDGTYSFVFSSDAAGNTGTTEYDIKQSVLESLSLGNLFENDAARASVSGIIGKDGKLEFVDFWNYTGFYMNYDIAPDGYESLMELANDNPSWNGQLSYAYGLLFKAVDLLRTQYNFYTNFQGTYKNSYSDGRSNIIYLYADYDNRKVYTNNSDWTDFSRLTFNLEMAESILGMAWSWGYNTGSNVPVQSLPAAYADIELVSPFDKANLSNSYYYLIGVDKNYPNKDYLSVKRTNFTESAGQIQPQITQILIFFALTVLVLVAMTILSGRQPQDEKVHLQAIDYFPTELAIITIPLIIVIAVVLADASGLLGWLANAMISGENSWIAFIMGVLLNAVLSVWWFSLVRRAKAHTLWKKSILGMLCRFTARVFTNLPMIWKTLLGLLGGGIAAVILLVLAATHFRVYSTIVFILFFMAVSIVLISLSLMFGNIRKGVSRIFKGETDYKIPTTGMFGEMKVLAREINSIGQGIERAVEESLKSERMKTDLITNVSHDIKTPLTSIINYVDLLKQENLDDKKIQHYLEVLEAKALRLKVLTEDIVEASKASSGNLVLEYADINLSQLLQQVSGEFTEKFKSRKLTEVISLPEEEMIIRADGQKMYRILDNLYENAAKYAHTGTRVYTQVKRDPAYGGRISFIMKNISEMELNITAQELTERFIRGDVARTTEGSGLGLSIAKSLTELMGGTFSIYVDGDLFRATVEFPEAAKAAQAPAQFSGQIN